MTDNIIIFHFYMCDVIQLLALHLVNEIFETIFWTQIGLLQVTRDDEFRTLHRHVSTTFSFDLGLRFAFHLR
jgi:hypothetical protein